MNKTQEEIDQRAAERRERDRLDFRNATEDVLKRCSEWLAENAPDLANRFAGGCRKWSIEFTTGDDGLFPEVRINVDKFEYDIIKPYVRILEEGMPDDIGSAFGSEIFEDPDEEWTKMMDGYLEKDKAKYQTDKPDSAE